MTEPLKIGTLAQRSSPWGKAFKAVESTAQERSHGRLEIEFFYDGTHSDVGRDGVAASATHLSRVFKPIIALQIPGLFSSWSKALEARAALLPGLEQGARGAGLAILGWGDVGLVRILAREAIHSPHDLRGRRVRVSPTDTITAALCEVVGATPVMAAGHEVLRALEEGAIDVLFAPVIAAEHMQWLRHLDHVTDVVVSAAVGGVAVAQARVGALPAELQALLRGTFTAALAELGPSVRAEDEASLRRMEERGRVVTPPRDALRKWQRTFQEVRRALSTALPAELIHRVERLSR